MSPIILLANRTALSEKGSNGDEDDAEVESDQRDEAASDPRKEIGGAVE
jgi:hypothetical protein